MIVIPVDFDLLMASIRDFNGQHVISIRYLPMRPLKRTSPFRFGREIEADAQADPVKKNYGKMRRGRVVPRSRIPHTRAWKTSGERLFSFLVSTRGSSPARGRARIRFGQMGLRLATSAARATWENGTIVVQFAVGRETAGSHRLRS